MIEWQLQLNYFLRASPVDFTGIDFTLLNTPKNHKPINNEKGKQIRETESHIDTMVKNDRDYTFKDNILRSLHRDIKDMINR